MANSKFKLSLSEFVRSKIKGEIPHYYAVFADVVTNRFSKKEIYYFVYVMWDFAQMKNLIYNYMKQYFAIASKKWNRPF